MLFQVVYALNCHTDVVIILLNFLVIGVLFDYALSDPLVELMTLIMHFLNNLIILITNSNSLLGLGSTDLHLLDILTNLISCIVNAHYYVIYGFPDQALFRVE